MWGRLTLSLQVVDGLLNAGWLLLAFAAWRASWRYGRRQHCWAGLLALVCAAVLLFPTVSISDDLAEQSQVYDATASPISAKGGKELKQFVTVPGVPAVAHLWDIPVSELSFLQYLPVLPANEPISLAGSATGIHSPPSIL